MLVEFSQHRGFSGWVRKVGGCGMAWGGHFWAAQKKGWSLDVAFRLHPKAHPCPAQLQCEPVQEAQIFAAKQQVQIRATP